MVQMKHTPIYKANKVSRVHINVVIFVAHSYGGLIVLQVRIECCGGMSLIVIQILVDAKLQPRKYPGIYNSTIVLDFKAI